MVLNRFKNRTIPQRNDQEFVKEMKQLAKMRYLKNLENKEPNMAEMTRLLRKTDGYKTSIIELKNKRRKDDVRY